ncbi:uncharacterized protein LOC112567073 [Pomacea canaliculata]|uniref:uncharacterized protein LOC112567073 n=1 Tax=Pomacea canaliculata TaxID=400727 RepID=UPI000D7281C5|nr:uncharacterized protein LOC112567073 [Pomacea canaliculata]
MARKPVYGDRWSESCLERTESLGLKIFQRAATRKIVWPADRIHSVCAQDPVVPVSLDEAFSTMLNFMSLSSCQCKRYFKSAHSNKWSAHDYLHCSRYHTPPASTSRSSQRNPLHCDETVHVLLAPGTYSVTAGKDSNVTQTHIVHVHKGEAVNLDFVL